MLLLFSCQVVSDSFSPPWATRLLCPWDFPGKNTGEGYPLLLQGIFLTQGSNPRLLYCMQILTIEPPGKPLIFSCYVLGCFSCVQLFAPLWTVAHQAPSSMGFSRQEHWSGSPCPPPGDLPHPGAKPVSLISPALASGFLTTRATWEGLLGIWYMFKSLWIKFEKSTELGKV